MYWHIDADIISLIVIAAIYVCNRKMPPQDGTSLRNRHFSRCLATGMIITAIDIAASIIMEVPTTRFLYHFFMTLYFVSVELVIVEWFIYVLTILFQNDEKSHRIIARVVIATYVFYALFNLANPWTGLVYSLGPNNEYSRGPFFAAMLVLYASYTLVLFILILIRWKNIPKEYSGAVLLMTPVIIAIGIVVQLCVPGWLIIMPAYMICLVLAFLFLQTMRVRSSQELAESMTKVAETDQLTGLYNRSGMEMMVQKTLEESRGQGVMVLIADIDDLKLINDTMGHAEGDRTIRLVAEQLRRHFRTGDTVVRFGGDEFLVFLTGAFTVGQIKQSLQRLVGELNELRIGQRDDVPLHGSVGAAIGVVGADSFETLCSRADAALYHVKRHGKNGYALYEEGMENEV